MNHSLTALGRPTFLGAYFQLRDRIALEKGWNTDTCAKYDSAIVKTIVPHIAGFKYASKLNHSKPFTK